MELKKYVIIGSASFGGTDFAELIEAFDEEDAGQIGSQICAEWCESYGVAVYPMMRISQTWKSPILINIFELNYWAEVYDPEKHDQILY